MKTYIKQSDFNNKDKYQRIQGLINSVNSLHEGLYEVEEINKKATEAYFIDFYLSEVLKGGLSQFFYNSDFSPEYCHIIHEGLEKLKANKMLKIFETSCNIINELSDEDYANLINSDNENKVANDNSSKVLSQLEDLTKEFYQIHESEENLLDLNYNYIETIENLEIVDDEKYEELQNELLEAVPDYEDRLARLAEENEEFEEEYIAIAEKVCTHFGHEFVSLDDVDNGQEFVSEEELESNMNEDIWYCHITTNKGEHYLIIDENKATFINAENDEEIGSISLNN